jgi:hypothetical protein
MAGTSQRSSANTAAANYTADATSAINHEMTSLQQMVKIKLN